MNNVFENWHKHGGDNQHCIEKTGWLNKPWTVASSLHACDIIDYKVFFLNVL